MLVHELIGKKVKLTWRLWVHPGQEKVWYSVPKPFRGLAERWEDKRVGVGVILDARPTVFKWGKHSHDFLVQFECETWWLPRGAFDLVSHERSVRVKVISEVPEESKYLVNIDKKGNKYEEDFVRGYTIKDVEPAKELTEQEKEIAAVLAKMESGEFYKTENKPSAEDADLITKGILR